MRVPKLIISIAATLLTTTTSASALPDPHTVANKPTPLDIITALSGIYTLLNTTGTLNGKKIPDPSYGEHPVGIITYSKSGWMSATITATEPEYRPKDLSFPFKPTDSDAEWALVGKHSLGYAGPFSLSKDVESTFTKGQVIHGPLTVANIPSWQGTKQIRDYTIFDTTEGRLLKIESKRTDGSVIELWWKKVA